MMFNKKNFNLSPRGMRCLLVALLVMALVVGFVYAGELSEQLEPIVKIIYSGATPIKDSTATKAPSEKAPPEKAATIKTALDASLKTERYPLEVTTEFTILKYRCTDEMCGYWISATRGGKEVATNSPVWLINGNAPIDAVISETYDEKTKEQTVTLKEDPKLAAIQVLQNYVDNQPIGKPITGTKE